MPNWCCTGFTASGPAEDIARLREAILGSDGDKEIPFDFNRLDPMPSELQDTVTDFGTAHAVYYGDAELILGYQWVKRLEIETVEQLREHFDAIRSIEQQRTNGRRISRSTVRRVGMSGVASTGAQNGMPVTPK